MAITKQGENYKLDFYPDGRTGKRIVKLFPTKKAAQQHQKDVLAGKTKTDKQDNRRLSEFIHLWYELHGRSLKSSEDTRDRLLSLAKYLNDPVLRNFSVADFANYRKQRIDNGISEATMNRELSTLKALYRELKRLQLVGFDFPLLTVRKLKEKRMELSYLTKADIKLLLDAVKQTTNTSLECVVKISLATGARWSECEGLTLENLQNGGFYFTDTKNGHSRFVPVSAELYSLVKARLEKEPFQTCYGAFRSAFKRSGIQSAKGQLAHILRHSFASHFVMGGGNIRTLQQILGHTSLQMTMRYSHLAPEFLNQAVTLNPLDNLDV